MNILIKLEIESDCAMFMQSGSTTCLHLFKTVLFRNLSYINDPISGLGVKLLKISFQSVGKRIHVAIEKFWRSRLDLHTNEVNFSLRIPVR